MKCLLSHGRPLEQERSDSLSLDLPVSPDCPQMKCGFHMPRTAIGFHCPAGHVGGSLNDIDIGSLCTRGRIADVLPQIQNLLEHVQLFGISKCSCRVRRSTPRCS
jgi:hypothetical protein